MSGSNSNIVPPPSSNGSQSSIVNGLPAAPPIALSQQQQPEQYFQQHVLQQKQQMYPPTAAGAMVAPPPAFDSNVVNKYLPSTTTNAVNWSPTVSSAQPPIPNGPQSMRSSTASFPNPLNTLPAHLRPPTQNGPSLATLMAGTNGSQSAQSSRTASPGLISSAAPTLAPLPPKLDHGQERAMFPLAATAPNTNSNANSLASNLQNLNLNRSNGLPTSIPTIPSSQIATHPPSTTLHTTYADHQGVAAAGLTLNTPQALSNSSGTGPVSQHSPVPNMFAPNAPSSRHAATMFGNSNSPKLQGPTHPINLPHPSAVSSGTLYGPLATPPANVAASNQNLQNNNPLQQPQLKQPTPPLTQFLPQTTVGAAQRPAPLQPGQLISQNLGQPAMPAFMTQPPMAVQAPSPLTVPTPPQTLPGNLPPPLMPPPPQSLNGAKQQQFVYSQPYPPAQPAGIFGPQSTNTPLQYQAQKLPPPQQQQQAYPSSTQSQYGPPLSVAQQGFSRLWGQDTIDLMQNRHILSPATVPPPKIVLHNQFHESINCSPSIIRCTLAKIPESNSLLQKSRLPLGIVIHPFRDVNSLPVIQCMNIVRCRLCRTYINPFVYFVDSKMWKCNLCYRVNELPEDFQFDPATKTYGDVTRRPEVRSSTIEFIAPSEYMLRPPQPAMYLFLFDVSIIAQQSGYLETACSVLNRYLDEMPGDARTQIGFICFDSFVHFYSMSEGFNQPHEMTLLDIEDPFLPRPDGLLVNLKECKELVRDLLKQLPKRFATTHDPGSALGAALQVAFKLMQGTGGRITVFQSCLPNKGPGALEPREDPNNRSSKDVAHLNPATDFYKRYALECSGYQVAVDLFLMNQQYSDMATISGISKHSGGCVHHFPLYQKTKQHMVDSFKQCFKRYLTRKIGFEAVMRIRCTRGLQVHTFHGNFFVRSTDLLSLPNVNPDAGYGMQISYEESLTDVKTICFQAALLYTNSEGERRIRVHTICLPVTASLPEVMHSADTEAILGLLSKMAVDRSITSNLSDARDAFINATIDVFNAFKIAQNLPSGQSGQLIAPRSLALFPLYILALLKHPAFRVGTSTRLDDRVFAMDLMKTLPLDQLMKYIYPELYKVDSLIYHARNSNVTTVQGGEDDDEDSLPEVQRLQLSAEHLDSRSIFLMDCGTLIMIYVGLNVPTDVLESAFGVSSTSDLADYVYGLPTVGTVENDILKRFIMRLNYDKPYAPLVQIIRDTSTAKGQFIERLSDDRSESSLSYYEFLQHVRAQVK